MIGKNVYVMCEEEWIIKGKLSVENGKSIILTKATILQKFKQQVDMIEVMKDKIIFIFQNEE